jgi:(p)ppGpp synthase/HD superfamily hydrolase
MTTTTDRCRAKNPKTCWKHGTGLGFDAHREIREYVKYPLQHSNKAIFTTALKTYDSTQIASVVMAYANKTPSINAARVKKALLLAADLHKTDTRANRAYHERTPYIEHPLRNTLRIIRYGCDDEATLIGSLLHDTVEDHPFEIAREYAKEEPRDEEHAREISYRYIEKNFGKNAARMVEGMSNPISEDRYMPAAQKNAVYRDHVIEAIKNPRVAVGKISDFTDNALSLHHTEAGMSAVSLYKKSTKYLGVIDELTHRVKQGYVNNDLPISEIGYKNILNQLTDGKAKLLDIQRRYSPEKAA